MNTKHLARVFLVVGLIAMSALLFLKPRHQKTKEGVIENQNQSNESSYIVIKGMKKSPILPPYPLDKNKDTGTNVTHPSKLDPETPVKDLMFGSVDVYGKVVDQDDNPLPNVLVRFIVDQSIMESVKHTNGTTFTDLEGRFHITGYLGAAVSFQPEVEGYVLADVNPHVVIKTMVSSPGESYVPDPMNPVLIKMHKLKGAENLVCVEKTFKFAPKQGSVFFDFQTGDIVSSGGDMFLTLVRPPGVLSIRNKAEWSISFGAVDGGIQTSTREMRLVGKEAPLDGYQEKVVFTMLPEDRNWGTYLTANFCVKSRQAQVYSKVGISFDLNEDPNGICILRLYVLSNANGSRNWEEAPGKVHYIKN